MKLQHQSDCPVSKSDHAFSNAHAINLTPSYLWRASEYSSYRSFKGFVCDQWLKVTLWQHG
jgi:hypothetical protein